MDKRLKYTIIVLVVAVVIYVAYRFFKKPKEVDQVVKQPVKTESTKTTPAPENQQARGPVASMPQSVISVTMPGITLPSTPVQTNPVSTPSTTSTTSTPTTLSGTPTIKTDPSLGLVVVHPATDQPTVSDLSNGIAADQPASLTTNTDIAPI